MITNIKLTQIFKEKNDCGKWETKNQHNEIVDEQFYKNVIDAKKIFKSIGASEKHEKSFTRYGYKTIRVTSTSPDGNSRHVWEFDFESAEI